MPRKHPTRALEERRREQRADYTAGIQDPVCAYSASPAGTARDVITDFVSNQDRIDLSAIDANTTVAGNQAFSSLVVGDPFSRTFSTKAAISTMAPLPPRRTRRANGRCG